MNISRSSSPLTECRASCLIASLALVILLGCRREPYSCVKVSGKISYEDGSLIPAKRIRIVFHSQETPIDSKTPPKPGQAEVDVQTGTFDGALTYHPNDGIIAGEHKVVIQCFSDRPQSSKLVPAEYEDQAKTPLKVQSSESPFDFKIRKP